MVINDDEAGHYARLSIWCFVIVCLVVTVALARMAW